MTFGIHDLAFKAPALYLPIQDLAEARGIEADKLRFGLGLQNMSVCDANEDVVSLAAASVIQLLRQNPEIKPSEIGRIYVGTESSIDGAKPIATYVHHLVAEYFENNGVSAKELMHCDVVDMTFACIGAVDAMHNSLAWLKSEPDKVAIVVSADIANYDLGSSGEYTQGAGAIAVLLKENPDLLVIGDKWGVATKSEHDFFKPIRLKVEEEEIVSIHDEKPIFDGQFSNTTYQNRITEAWKHFSTDNHFSDYSNLVFHLPYAFHGRRIITSLLIDDLKTTNQLASFAQDLDSNSTDFIKLFSKTDYYKHWVKQHVAAGEKLSSEMGNLYTASIFLCLMSSLMYGEISEGDKFLFFAYGSGSKAKVFEGQISADYAKKINQWNVEEQLKWRRQINFETYLQLRNNQVASPISDINNITQTASGITETNKFERTYSLNV
ncbi:MAG: hypothetical protein RLZZ337_1152 [Bacteroidota bacterium]|jgi:hydroxymethylglutaryl-CoA synthase